MQKQLVTIDNLDEFICQSSNVFYMDGTKILTPGAKDELIKRGISIEYGQGCNHPGTSCAAASAGCNTSQVDEQDEMLIAIAATLQKEYGVTNPDELKKLSRQVFQTLHDNLSIF